MALSKEQLGAIADRYRRMHVTRDVWPEEQALFAELNRLAHGPFTLAEARASGIPFKRPGWHEYAYELVNSDEYGYMCFGFSDGNAPADASDITACDYELMTVEVK